MNGIVLSVVCSGLLSFASGASVKDYEDANELMEDYFRWRASVFPLEASKKGIHDHDLELRDNSLEGYKDIEAGCVEFNRLAFRLLESEAGKRTSKLDRHYLQMMVQNSGICAEGMKFRAYLMYGPSFIGGVQGGLPNAFKSAGNFQLNDLKDYQVVLQRLRKVPTFLENTVELLKEGVKQNLTLAMPSLVKSEKQFANLLSTPTEESRFFALFKDLNVTYPANEFDMQPEDYATLLMEEARGLIEEEIMPKFKELQDYVFGTYVNHSRSDIAITSVPDGHTYYQFCLAFHARTGITPEEVHQIGLDEIKQLREGVLVVAKQVGQENATFSEFIQIVRNDPEQSFASEEELLGYINELLEAKIKPEMTRVLPEKYVTEEKLKLAVEPVPPGVGLIAYYDAKPFFGDTTNATATYYLNLEKLDNFKKFELMALTLHEAVPGHHLHLTSFLETSDFPNFLKVRIAPTYDELPSSPPYYTAMLEGWGLYAEYLGLELGLYEDPYDLLGYYSFNLLRAARLVVDTGMHALGWSRQQAIDYLLENTALSEALAEGEIDRYITWPGQATAYKIGDRVIREIRKKTEEELGDAFDMKVFHEHLLKCFGTLDSLEDCLQLMREIDSGGDAPGN